MGKKAKGQKGKRNIDEIIDFRFWILNEELGKWEVGSRKQSGKAGIQKKYPIFLGTVLYRLLKNFQNKSEAKYCVFIKKMGANPPRLLYKRGKGYGIRGKR